MSGLLLFIAHSPLELLCFQYRETLLFNIFDSQFSLSLLGAAECGKHCEGELTTCMKPFRSAISSLDLCKHQKYYWFFCDEQSFSIRDRAWVLSLRHIPISKRPREKKDCRSSASVPHFSPNSWCVLWGPGPLAGLCLLNTETAGNHTMFSKFSSLASWLTQLKTLAHFLRGKLVACWGPLGLQCCHSSTVQSQSSTGFSPPAVAHGLC